MSLLLASLFLFCGNPSTTQITTSSSTSSTESTTVIPSSTTEGEITSEGTDSESSSEYSDCVNDFVAQGGQLEFAIQICQPECALCFNACGGTLIERFICAQVCLIAQGCIDPNSWNCSIKKILILKVLSHSFSLSGRLRSQYIVLCGCEIPIKKSLSSWGTNHILYLMSHL